MANKKSYLGEFEQIVLLTLVQLNNDAYGVKIRAYLKEAIDRDVAIGALYATLERLETKGLVSSVKGEATAIRGGKAKRYFSITAYGEKALMQVKKQHDTLWSGINLAT